MSEKSLTVLIADDDELLRKIMCRIVEGIDGVEVIEAKDGREAVELAARHTPDMLLFDINMPHLDGIEACEVIFKRQGGRRLPVWFVTGDYEHLPRGRAEAVGARGLLIKPFNSYEIRDAVQSVLAEAAAA